MNEFRKLAAILLADIVGYSRLTGVDEDGMLARVRAMRSDVIEPLIKHHAGRMVKWTGDGALVEFRSVVHAVEFAVSLQERMKAENSTIAHDDRIDLRIGIHLGDVIEESDGDLMGDGVNIAARLESIAPPGGICLSEDAYRQVRSRLKLNFDDMGMQSLKNISEPMRAYALSDGAAHDRPERGGKNAKPVPSTAKRTPSIAVLPFANLSKDPDQQYFVDGMAEDLITALSKFDQLFVISRNSSFVFKDRAVSVKEIGQELGVRYLVEGSVRRAGDRIRITGQLIDSDTGSHLWADRFDGQFEDVFDLQDKITANVVGAIEPTIRKAEIERARNKSAGNLDAYDLFLQALPLLYAVEPEGNSKALALLMESLDFDPEYAAALAHASWGLVQRITRPWSSYSEDDHGLAVSFARRALQVGNGDAQAVVLGGFTLVMLREDYLMGLAAVRRAVELNAGSGFVNAMAGCALVFGDDAEAGLELLNRAMLLGPKDPNFFIHLCSAGYGHLANGDPEEALQLGLRSAALNEGWDSTYLLLITAYTLLDREKEARNTAEKLLRIHRDAKVSEYGRSLPIRNRKLRSEIIDSLQKAGVPD